MTSVFTARRRAEEFARAVDGGDVPTAGELAELVGVVDALRSEPVPEPDPDFVLDLRSRLMAEAATALRPENAQLVLPERPRGARERRLVAAASALVLVGGTAGMATAAQSALPGEPLYPVKRGLEQAETGLHMGSAAKGRELLDQAADRLEEVRSLLASDAVTAAPAVPATLQDFTDQAREGSDLLFASFEETRDPQSVETVRTFTADSARSLARLAAGAPDEAQDDLQTAATTLRAIDEHAAALCQSCAESLPPLDLPRIFLVRAEADRALKGAGSADLDNSHPVVVDPRAVTQATRKHTTSGDGDALPQAPATPLDTSTPDPTSTTSPSDGLSPNVLPSLPLPGSGSKDGDGTSGGSDGGGLLGGVETLLPDAGDLLR